MSIKIIRHRNKLNAKNKFKNSKNNGKVNISWCRDWEKVVQLVSAYEKSLY